MFYLTQASFLSAPDFLLSLLDSGDAKTAMTQTVCPAQLRSAECLEWSIVTRAHAPHDRRASSAPSPRSTGAFRSGPVALSLCTTAHPLHTRFANVSGASFSEATEPYLQGLDDEPAPHGRRLEESSGDCAACAALEEAGAGEGSSFKTTFDDCLLDATKLAAVGACDHADSDCMFAICFAGTPCPTGIQDLLNCGYDNKDGPGDCKQEPDEITKMSTLAEVLR